MNDITLKDYIDSRFYDLRDTIDARFEGLAKSMEAMNYESRNKFPTREEINDIIKEINGKIDSLRISEATLAGKASQSAVNIVTFISVAGIVIAIVAVIIHFV